MSNIISRFFKTIFSNFKHKYRFVVMDEHFHTKFSFRLSRINVFVALGVLIVFLIIGTTALIAFTPLKEFIPGYMRDDVIEMSYDNHSKLDSLENVIELQKDYIEAITCVITGKQPVFRNVVSDSIKSYDSIDYKKSDADLKLRKIVEGQKKPIK